MKNINTENMFLWSTFLQAAGIREMIGLYFSENTIQLNLLAVLK